MDYLWVGGPIAVLLLVAGLWMVRKGKKDMPAFVDVFIPAEEEAARIRQAAKPFEMPGQYVPNEDVPTFAALPVITVAEDGIHLRITCAGLRATVLPICARSARFVMETFLLANKRENKIASYDAPGAAPELKEVDAPESVTLPEVGGSDFYVHQKKLYLGLADNSGTSARIGPMTLGDAEQVMLRLKEAFDSLPLGATERSVVKLKLTAPMKRVIVKEGGPRIA